jgi:hypothetical protein
MADRRPTHRPPMACRHRVPMPMPAGDEGAHPRTDLLSPSWLAPCPRERRDPRQPQRLIRRRQRRPTLPGLVARLVRLVWRRRPAGGAGQQGLARAGLVWVPPLRVRPQAITQRLDTLPAAVMGPRCPAVWPRLQAQAPTAGPSPRWAPVRAPVAQVTRGAGSTLAARRHTTPGVRERAGVGLAGTRRGRVDACRHAPRWPLSTADAPAQDQRFAAESRAAVPAGALLVFARGWVSCRWGADGMAAHRCWVTRRRAKTA